MTGRAGANAGGRSPDPATASPSVQTTRDAFLETASGATAPGVRIPVEVQCSLDPFEAYRRARTSEPSFFYETSGGQSGWGYFGVSPTGFQHCSPNSRPEAAFDQEPPVREPSMTLDTIETALEGESLRRGDCAVPYPGGLFGWLSYDVVRELEALPASAAQEPSLPRLQLGTYPTVAAWREPFEEGDPVSFLAAPRIDAPAERDSVERAYERARTHALTLAEHARTGEPATAAPPVAGETATFSSRCGREAFAQRVRAVKQWIREGETFQANVSHTLEAPAVVHPLEVYAAMRRVNPAPYSGLIEFPDVALVSASPELLLERVGDQIRTEPIAGTRPRGETSQEDDAFEAELRGDEKERAEHAMLVDLERNDLGEISTYGTVTVDAYRAVHRYAEVMHLVSSVSGTLRADATLADAIAAVFPGGTITGAPKPKTMELIETVESTRRGPYTGSMAAIGFDGRATLNIAIRTLLCHDERYQLRVGAGIVHDSDPDREYEETIDKARGVLEAVETALDAQLTVSSEAES